FFSSCLLFFFHDPPTPEIYTLSLHDALPIYANASSVVALFSGTFAGAWAYRRNILAVAEFSVLGLFVLSLVGGLIGALLLLWTPDRKSTRLNSSHVAISYAVFCLKKKNTHTV